MPVSARRQLHIKAAGAFVALLCLLLMAGCGGSSGSGAAAATEAPTATTAPTATAEPATPTPAASNGPATITMDSFSFDNNTVTIKAGDKVNFDDSAGGTHILVIGSSGQFKAQNGAPSELNTSKGVTFTPGMTMEIKFPTAGVYKITCKIHPSMEATVTVTA